MTAAIGPIAEAIAGAGGEAAAWGGAGGEAVEEAAEGGSLTARTMDVGNGNTLELDPEQLMNFLRSPEILAMLEQKGHELADKANEMAITEGAEYSFILQANDGYETPQIFLIPWNFQAKIDDAAHSTLLKVAASVQDDVEIPTGENEEVLIPVETPEFEDYRLPEHRTLWSRAAGR
jgi:hypothetical protein